jgi:hypothetical protein
MKFNILILFTFLLISSCTTKTETAQTETLTETKTEEITKQLRHVVLFKFKEEATPEDIQKVEAAFVALSSKIKEIKDLEWGLNNSPEGLNKDFTHCFFVTFDSEAAREVYLPHPAHKAFVEVLGPHLDDVLVLDYWVK